jgi:hypothetical protein
MALKEVEHLVAVKEVATECLVPAALAQAMYLVLKEAEH